MKVYRFIINPKAGHGKAGSLNALISNWKLPDEIKFEIAFTEYAGHATELAATAVRDHCYAVIAVGGDGTVNEIARSVKNSQTALGILPMGSGNGLARHLGYPMQIPKAIQFLLNAVPGKADLIRINDHLSVNVSGLGFDGYVAWLFNHAGKRGLSTYTSVALKSYASYAASNFKIQSEGIAINEAAHMLVIANGSQFGNKAIIAPGADVGDGLMNVVLVHKPPYHRLPGLFLRLFTGKLKDNAWIRSFSCREFTVKTSRSLHLHIDGESVPEVDFLKAEILPAALTILKGR